MAEGDAKQQQEVFSTNILETTQESEQKLRYLDFVQVATLYVIACLSGLYSYAKENSGPLKPGVQTVEDTVKTVVGPVYEKFRDVPIELLKFVDRKVDSSVSELESHVPSLVKEASCKAYSTAQNALQPVLIVISQVKQTGLVDAATFYACAVYEDYAPVGEKYAVSAWRKLNKLPLFPQVAKIIVVPTMVYWAEKYNQVVVYTAERDYRVSSYLPLIPTEKIAKVFGEEDVLSAE